MKKIVFSVIGALLACGAYVYAAQDTDIEPREVREWKKLEPWLEANASDAETRIATLEASDVSDGGTIQGAVTVISTNSATTNVIITVDGVLDGETIGDDTIDDDSIDFGDVTGADLTLTDCGVITSSGKITGTEIALSATQYFDVINTTQLVFIAGAVTNVIDADITTP